MAILGGMDTNTDVELSVWDRLLKHYGTQVALAKAAGVSQPGVWKRMKLGRDVPAVWARRIHDDSGIPLRDMRPDLWPD